MVGPRGIECRSGGGTNDYALIFTFTNNLTSVASASVTGHDPVSGTGTVLSSALGLNANQYTVNLTNVSNAQNITVTLNSVLDAAGGSGNVVGPQMVCSKATPQLMPPSIRPTSARPSRNRAIP